MTDYSDILDKLREFNYFRKDLKVCHDAADAIEAQAKRIEELEAALKPFTIELLPSHNVYGCEMVFVKPEEIATAREVLEGK
jgi:hypothetical protein